MRDINVGDTTYRNALLKQCMETGMSTEAIAEIAAQMRGKPNAEKERIAKGELELLDVQAKELAKKEKTKIDAQFLSEAIEEHAKAEKSGELQEMMSQRVHTLPTPQLTMHQEHLILGLRLFDLTEEEQENILLFLEKEADQIAMIDYLLENQHTTQQDILTRLAEILKETTAEETGHAF